MERAHQANYKTFDIQSAMPANYARAMMAQTSGVINLPDLS